MDSTRPAMGTRLPWKKCEWIESAIGDIVSTQEEAEFSIRNYFFKSSKRKTVGAEIRDDVVKVSWVLDLAAGF